MKLQQHPHVERNVKPIQLASSLRSKKNGISIYNLASSLRVDRIILQHNEVGIGTIVNRLRKELMPEPHIVASIRKRIRSCIRR